MADLSVFRSHQIICFYVRINSLCTHFSFYSSMLCAVFSLYVAFAPCLIVHLCRVRVCVQLFFAVLVGGLS